MTDTTDTPAARCPDCGAPVTRSRFCGACGALLDDVFRSRDQPPADGTGVAAGPASAGPVFAGPVSAGPASAGPASAGPAAQRPGPDSNIALARAARAAASRPTIVGGKPAPHGGDGTSVERRTLLVGLAALVVGALAGVVGSRRYWLRQALDDDGLPTAPAELGAADELAAQIDADGPVVIPDEGGGGRIAVVRWDPSYVSELGSARERYGPDGEDHPVLDLEIGLMVLSLVSTHLGCRVQHCATSRWFEDPCHGSTWNAWGEWTGGPAPRGLDRYAAHVRDDGILVAELTQTRFGPDRESGVLDQEPEGPSCVEE